MALNTARDRDYDYANFWQDYFARRRRLDGNLDDKVVTYQRDNLPVSSQRSNFEMFFEDDSAPDSEIEDLHDLFTRGLNLSDIIQQGGGSQDAAWVDQRSFADKDGRNRIRIKGRKKLKAHEVLKLLSAPVCYAF